MVQAILTEGVTHPALPLLGKSLRSDDRGARVRCKAKRANRGPNCDRYKSDVAQNAA